MARTRLGGAALRAALLLLVLSSEDCGNPTATSPTPAPTAPPRPVAAAPTITCPPSITVAAQDERGAPATYPVPDSQGGEGSVTVRCIPESGAFFAVGASQVECSATDTLMRTEACAFTVTVTPFPSLRLRRFLAFGDSITAGDVVVPGTDDVQLATATEPYPAVLQQLLRARFGSQPIVANAGLSGEKPSAATAAGRLNLTFRSTQSEAVIILEGANDLLYSDPAEGIVAGERGVSVLAAEARNLRARVFIALLPPTRPGRRQIPLAVIQSFNDRLRVIARGEGARVIDTFTPLLADLNGNIGSDGLHLTPTGYRRLAEVVYAAIREDLEIK